MTEKNDKRFAIRVTCVANRMSDVNQTAKEEESADEESFVDAQVDVEKDVASMHSSSSSSRPLSSGVVSLDEGLAVAFEGLELFLGNRFEEAKEKAQCSAENSMYHSVSYATIFGLQAMMTLDQTDIANALEAAKKSVHVAKQMRKRGTMLAWNRNKHDYTLEELHAELVYAESLLLYALLTFLEDENLVSFVKAAFKVRRCYLAYQECHKLLSRYQWTSVSGKAHFESGVRLGYGLFNVLLSNLPPRILSLLEFVGFSGDKEVGLRELEMGINIQGGLRTPLCWLAMLSFDLVAVYAFGLTQNNLPRSENILKKALTCYPQSVMFLFFRGKFEQVSGRFVSAIEMYERAIDSQSQWAQFHHLCEWEMMATHTYLADWLLAMKFAEKLYQTSRWSKALYQYLKACFMLELISEYNRHPSDKADAETIRAMQLHVAQLMEEVPTLRQRIAGKSVPVEKFAAAKAARYSKTGKICMPGIEMIIVLNWNRIMAADQASCIRMLEIIDEELQLIGFDPATDAPDNSSYKMRKLPGCCNDDQALAIFLRGAFLHELNREEEAKRYLMACTTTWSESSLSSEATYVLPGSWIELAHIAVKVGDIKLAKSYLDEARAYKQYHHVSRMQFRIHALQQEISVIEGQVKRSADSGDNGTSSKVKSTSVATSK